MARPKVLKNPVRFNVIVEGGDVPEGNRSELVRRLLTWLNDPVAMVKRDHSLSSDNLVGEDNLEWFTQYSKLIQFELLNGKCATKEDQVYQDFIKVNKIT